MKKILVLLSTYNGERYLREQLKSIFFQKDVNVSILVRDDGSQDGTTDILNDFKKIYPSQLIIEKGNNIGCRNSFFWLIKKAATFGNDYDYYAFADQDDVWFEDKLISGTKALDKSTNNYKVYFCSYQLVDENLKYLPTHNKAIRKTIEESFVYQPCIGCSMIMSPFLIEKVAMSNPDQSCIHDAWTYRVNLALGGDVIQDMDIHMLYRQHSANTIGSRQSWMKRWKRRLKIFTGKIYNRSGNALEMLNLYRDYIPKEQWKALETLAQYNSSISCKLKLLFSKRYASNYKNINIMFKIGVLFNGI